MCSLCVRGPAGGVVLQEAWFCRRRGSAEGVVLQKAVETSGTCEPAPPGGFDQSIVLLYQKYDLLKF